MKTMTKILFVVLVIGGANAFAATCEATNGWLVVTSQLEVGKTRVPGNAMIEVYEDQNQLLVGFSAESNLVGTEPEPGEQDIYQIEAVFQDNIGLKAFSWSTPYDCPRCPPDWGHLPSSIKIHSDSGSFYLVCKQ